MIKRIEFTLNLDDPREAEIYQALKPSLRYRRAGAVIRQALGTFLVTEDRLPPPLGFRTVQEDSAHE